MPFDPTIRTKVLLWYDRHCCLCKKSCGTNIELHHLDQEAKGGGNELDNVMPLCFDCHSEVMRYNDEHPKGSKHRPEELKARREQVYEEFTRHLVPPIDAQITNIIPGGNQKRQFPNVGFILRHLSDSLPVRVKVFVESVLEKGKKAIPSDHYAGRREWNMNPRFMFSGNFSVPKDLIPPDKLLELRVKLLIIDQYNREHEMLPVGLIYQPNGDYWYAEP